MRCRTAAPGGQTRRLLPWPSGVCCGAFATDSNNRLSCHAVGPHQDRDAPHGQTGKQGACRIVKGTWRKRCLSRRSGLGLAGACLPIGQGSVGPRLNSLEPETRPAHPQPRQRIRSWTDRSIALGRGRDFRHAGTGPCFSLIESLPGIWNSWRCQTGFRMRSGSICTGRCRRRFRRSRLWGSRFPPWKTWKRSKSRTGSTAKTAWIT